MQEGRVLATVGIEVRMGKRVEHGTDGVGVTACFSQLMLNVTGELNKVLSCCQDKGEKHTRCEHVRLFDASMVGELLCTERGECTQNMPLIYFIHAQACLHARLNMVRLMLQRTTKFKTRDGEIDGRKSLFSP